MTDEEKLKGFELCADGKPCIGNKYVSCPFSPRNNAEQNCGVTMAKYALALLKEQEIKYPVCEKCGKKIDHIITSVFNYDGSDSEYSFPITYNEDGGCIQFSTTQNWTGYELSDTEQKNGIRCPFCREFPFDANEEIELYEPEEVVVMMWEGR